MAIQRHHRGARRGLAAPPGAAQQTRASYTVLKEIAASVKIAGKRRQKGDVFHALPRHMTYLVLEGVVGLTPAASPPAGKGGASSGASPTTPSAPTPTPKAAS